ncbi:uncharacterized protein LOC119079110 [Bradysia coprophila]|uniref:uncharacterized protein LOC119079110 n=1 Tax=Bradysia coprophila TaxID=38358 RepID=UPI00187DDA55|nr:uncharacterized protein LOC119079110 [Bradysia coprophila]
MKAILSVVFVILCSSTLGSADIPGTLVGFSRLASRVAEPSCLNLVTPICKDCNTLLRCLMVDPAPEVPCKTQYPDRPFCHNGACVAEAQGDCVASTTFTCTGAGYYPDPLNCSRYHLCAGAGAVGTSVATYECPAGFVYNPVTTMCKLSTECTPVDCSPDPAGYVAYPADNRYYAYCRADDVPVILKCGTYFVYNTSTKVCVFHCPREGRIALPSDTKTYYECYLKDTTYYYRISECINGYVFDQTTEQCKPA